MDIYDQRPLDAIRDELGWKDNIDIQELTTVCMILCDRISKLEAKPEKEQPVEAKCGCKHEDRFDCEYMDENKNCAINKKG